MLGTMISVLYTDENLLLRHKMNRRVVELLSPAFTRVIEQGVEEGVFDVEFPGETAEMILELGNVYAELNIMSLLELAGHPENLDRLKKRINVYAATLERVLGAPQGSFAIADDRSMRLVMKLAESADGVSVAPDNRRGNGR